MCRPFCGARLSRQQILWCQTARPVARNGYTSLCNQRPKGHGKLLQARAQALDLYGSIPEEGKGLCIGVYQAQADSGSGATEKNMDRLERVAKKAKKRGVQLLSFPQLYVSGYTLSPKLARKVAQFKGGTSITRERHIPQELRIAMLVPYAEKARQNGTIFEVGFEPGGGAIRNPSEVGR